MMTNSRNVIEKKVRKDKKKTEYNDKEKMNGRSTDKEQKIEYKTIMTIEGNDNRITIVMIIIIV